MARETCSQCGRGLDADAPHGLCPSCLMRRAALDETMARTDLECTKCNATLGTDARFCARCGSAVPESARGPEDLLRRALDAKLGGQYRILRLLGRGGMGAVYLARDLTLEREVAIKVVQPASDAAGMYDRFRREAKMAAKLSHPNIVPLHAFGEVDGMPYFVMGYVRGESLADRMRREGKVPEQEARRIIAEIADALDHAHRQGVVHRDVKPDNVLLEDASGRALLTDFGVARPMNHSESLTQHGGVVGTPHYMSPEQAAGRPGIDGRSDIYSLGVMGYAMVAGRLPFEGTSTADILAKHLTQEPPPLRSLAPSISDSTLQAIEQCLAKDPARRWQDSRALKAAIGNVEEGALPDALEAIRGHGVPYVLIASGLLLMAWYIVLRIQGAPLQVFGVITAGLLFCYVAVVFEMRREGFPVSLVQRVIWTEPGWWPTWYPRSLRRHGNVWDRLPVSVRRLRFVPLVIIAAFAITAFERYPSPRKLFVTFFIVAIGGGSEYLVKRQLKRMGVASPMDRNRIAFLTPPSRTSFWSQPRIAAILADVPGTAVDPHRRADSPRDQLQAILRIGDELSGPLRPLGAEAAAAARQLVASIEHSDQRIADLARNLEPGEEQRLAEKIAALAESQESAAMRGLLEKQLELIRGLVARIEEAKETRSRHIEMLKTLALHLTSLRARLAEGPSDIVSLSESVRALCERISATTSPLHDPMPQ